MIMMYQMSIDENKLMKKLIIDIIKKEKLVIITWLAIIYKKNL